MKNNQPNVRGEFTMVFRDEITNEILRTEQHTNLITTGGFHEIFLSNGWLSDPNPGGDVGFEDMFVMDFPMVKAARTYHRLFNSTGAVRLFESSQVQNWTRFDGPPTFIERIASCLLYTSPSPRDKRQSRMPSSA